jgi:hypothetical protein
VRRPAWRMSMPGAVPHRSRCSARRRGHGCVDHANSGLCDLCKSTSASPSAHVMRVHRARVVEEARERLYGDVQSYSTLLVVPGFWAEALHVWETDASKGEASWREIARIPLPSPRADA